MWKHGHRNIKPNPPEITAFARFLIIELWCQPGHKVCKQYSLRKKKKHNARVHVSEPEHRCVHARNQLLTYANAQKPYIPRATIEYVPVNQSPNRERDTPAVLACDVPRCTVSGWESWLVGWLVGWLVVMVVVVVVGGANNALLKWKIKNKSFRWQGFDEAGGGREGRGGGGLWGGVVVVDDAD